MKLSIFSIITALLAWIALGIFLWFNHATSWYWHSYVEMSIMATPLIIVISTWLYFEWRKQYKIILSFIRDGLWARPEGLDTHAD